MGFDPLTLAVVGGSAALQANSARRAANTQNDAIDRSQQSLTRSTQAQQNQLADSAAFEKRKLNLQSAQIAGRIRAATGGAISGSDLALIRQNAITLEENRGVVDINFQNQIERIQSGFEADAAQLSAGLVDPGLASLQGGLSGFSTGLSILTGLGQISQLGKNPVQSAPLGPVNII